MLAQPHEAVASGAVASFRTDVLSPLKMQFDLVPIQDLHGQANPYPPGGGKNKLDYDTVMPNLGFTKQSDGSWYTASASAVGMKTLWENTGEIAGSISITYTYKYSSSSSQGARFKFLYTDGTITDNYAEATESYFTKSFTSNAEKTLLKIETTYGTGSVSTWIKDIQVEIGSATSFAPYSNICPITGHDGFTRTGTGKNLVDLSVIANQGSNVTEIENGYAFNATSTQYSTGIVFSPPLTGVYTLSAKCKNGTGKNFRLRLHYSDGTTAESNTTGTEEGFVTMTKTSNSTKSIDSIRFNWSSSGTFEVKELQLEQGTIATAYQPFGHSYSTTFPTPPGTVYGGHVTDNGDGTGTLVLTHKMDDMGNLTWNRSANYDYFTANITEMRSYSAGETPSITCEIYKTTTAKGASSWLNAEDKTIGTRATYTNLVVKDTSYTDKDAFKTAVSGYKVVYPLAEPVTYTLPLDIIQSLIGQNNVWVDNADSVTVEYWGH